MIQESNIKLFKYYVEYEQEKRYDWVVTYYTINAVCLMQVVKDVNEEKLNSIIMEYMLKIDTDDSIYTQANYYCEYTRHLFELAMFKDWEDYTITSVFNKDYL